MRTIVDLKDREIQILSAICDRDGISRSEAIRRAVRLLAERLLASTPQEAFGLWKDQNLDSIGYVDQLRKEWDR